MIPERLVKCLNANGISVYSLENTIGASRGAIAKAINENKNIGSNFVENILIHYADLNPSWLLTGEGEMLKSSAPAQQPLENTLLLSEIKELRIENKELNKQIGRLEGKLEGELKGKDEVITILKEELHLLKKDFQTPNVRVVKRAAI